MRTTGPSCPRRAWTPDRARRDPVRLFDRRAPERRESQLDSLTRFELQDTLLRVWEETRQIVVMVTHDVDEALYLADRLILMTDGPEATVGEVMEVPFPRPRVRSRVLAHPEYYDVRGRVLDFLDHHAQQSRSSTLDAVLARRSS
jgi:ABC-type sulfate/molybdate transport systems ATPase subunit